MATEWDAERIRQHIREALQIAKGCVLEIIMKDVRTCAGQPNRLSEWVQIAQELTTG